MDFNSLSISGKSSMRRKSLLQAFGKGSSASRQSAIPLNAHSQSHASTSAPSSTTTTPLTNHPATFGADEMGVYSPTSEYDTFSMSSSSAMGTSRHPSVSHGHGYGHAGPAGQPHPLGPGHGQGGRSISANYTLKEKGRDKENSGTMALRRPEDVLRLVKERMLSWSYMMEWYQGETEWLSTVRIPRSVLESTIGGKALESRARNYHVLGTSLSALFDIPSAVECLRALVKLLDDYDSFADGGGGKGVKNLFRGQRSARKVTTGGSILSEYAAADGSESYLLNVTLPFVPDFYQVHSTLCSIIPDMYKKLLGMFLPPSSAPHQAPTPTSSLLHPSTIIHSAPLDSPFAPGPLGPSYSPASATTATFPNPLASPTSTSDHGHTRGHRYGQSFSGAIKPVSHGGSVVGPDQAGSVDALSAYIAGDLPSDRTLVGDGQKMTPQIAELFLKADAKLKKHFSLLVREGDALARKVLDDELGSLLGTLTGSGGLTFENMAKTGHGDAHGWAGNNPGGLAGVAEDER
ncbi:hypothetical protein IAU60_006271 [Kwoniella sp. DSM 27419]